ncbi:MAG: hypothetical protein SFY95_08130 [Planctomycetota bacterium]|nr:hypothetical protein [Planctomycetota bacterium]
MKTLLAFAAASVLPASVLAQYSARVVGLGPGDSTSAALTLGPGDVFSAAVLLAGPSNIRHDSAVFRLVFSQSGLLYSPNWYQWAAPYVTGGPDDLSSPSRAASGILSASTHLDPIHPGQVDLAFENLTPNFGDYFFTGELLRLTLRVAPDATPGSIQISFADGSFTNGASSVSVAPVAGLTLNIIPAPASSLTGALALTALARRRR